MVNRYKNKEYESRLQIFRKFFFTKSTKSMKKSTNFLNVLNHIAKLPINI